MQSLKESLISQIKKEPAVTTSNIKDLLDDPTKSRKEELLSVLKFSYLEGTKLEYEQIFTYEKKTKTLIISDTKNLGFISGFDPNKLMELGINRILFNQTGTKDVRVYITNIINYPKNFEFDIKNSKNMVRLAVEDNIYPNGSFRKIKFEGPNYYHKLIFKNNNESYGYDRLAGSFRDWVKDLYLNEKVYFEGGLHTPSWKFSGVNLNNMENVFKDITAYQQHKNIGKLSGGTKDLVQFSMANLPYNIEGEFIIIRIDGSVKCSKQKDIDFWTKEVFLKFKRWKKYDTYVDNEYLVIY